MIKTPPRSEFRFLALAALVAVVAGCASSTVIREPRSGSRGPSGSSSSPVRNSVPKPGATVTVRRGDTLYGLATRNGIAASDLAAWNGLPPPYTIHPGQSLRLYPPGAGAPPVASAPSGPSSGGSAPAAPAPRPAAPASSGFSWRWPADGQIINRFSAGDPTKQGVDIAGSGGSPVRAAADGVVVYSGSGLVGYGELIIVKHNDSWLSTYGHNRRRLVNEGAVVKAGQQIAEMGRSGAPRDMLHFEIRYNSKPVDPLLYLPQK